MYRIIELQTNGDSQSMIDHGVQPDTDHADSVAHGVAQYAALSNVPTHTVVVLNPEGTVVIKYKYNHEPAPDNTETSSQEE